MKGGSAIRSSGNEISIKHGHFGIGCMCISCLVLILFIISIIQAVRASSRQDKINELTAQMNKDKITYASYISGERQLEQKREQTELDALERKRQAEENKETADNIMGYLTAGAALIGGLITAYFAAKKGQ